jgi:hypothetical protein
VSAPSTFINCNSISVVFLGEAVKNKKDKGAKREVKRKVAEMADQIGTHLEDKGWCVCDSFLPPDLVRRVRIEAGLFQGHYEQSEIWVGKGADVGAQVWEPIDFDLMFVQAYICTYVYINIYINIYI